MYHKLSRPNKAISDEKMHQILKEGEYGVLSTVDEDNQAYGVPLSYAIMDGYIYFHCSKKGHKLENIKYNNQVSFSVVGKNDAAYFDNDFTTLYESVIAFGKAEIVEDDKEKIESLRILCEKYLFEHMKHFDEAINSALKITEVVKIKIEHITGKSNRED